MHQNKDCPEHETDRKDESNSCHNQHSHGHSNHGIMMLICCLVMILGFTILSRLGKPLSYLVILLCPLMHIVMMRGMFAKK